MDNYATARQKDRSNAEIMGRKRQEKALREFKQVLEDLMFLLRSASEMETAYMYWVNRSREQFVMETKSTVLNNVMFKDRISFENHFLDQFKDLDEPTAIEIGQDLPAEMFSHYYNEVPVRYVTLLPFVNNGETVAITVLESTDHIFTENKSDVIYSYINALRNVLNTYLEISDLYEQQDEWIDYEDLLSNIQTRCHRAEMVRRLLNTIQTFLHDGGVSFITRGMDSWCNVMNADEAKYAPPIGMQMEERSLAYEAAEQGEAEFAIHFNNNPKRLSPRELHSEGASMAIPLMMKDRRQGVVLVYDKNPLIFKESTKHKLINLVRIAALQMQANDPKMDLDDSVFTNEYGAFLPDLWEKTVNAELHRLTNNSHKYHSWFGLVTISNVPELRTKLRLEQLSQMQSDLISAFNPSQFGYPGILGYNSDYVYTFFIQNKDEQTVKDWTAALKKKFSESFELKNGIHIETGIKAGYVRIDGNYDDSYQLLSNAKSALSQALKSNKNEAI
ncbi:GAF domain-containing protein [Fodinibius halophilus]|uniref:GAF domain-containing protein n=1 Tax=Fodinibius halophilus TaxID=1736908 RepID=A0A6M1TCI9_9BACT|nr:GAF domain-containing protein [Fodinibius halophilus]NGP90083.1 GAF domain-containing protein [Fodinibius halophilus]